eukprot:m.118194 g.118194  ORF g.118194 m.118194 type:complete len:361 (-) comp14504_c8_seq1:960-2042(-)
MTKASKVAGRQPGRSSSWVGLLVQDQQRCHMVVRHLEEDPQGPVQMVEAGTRRRAARDGNQGAVRPARGGSQGPGRAARGGSPAACPGHRLRRPWTDGTRAGPGRAPRPARGGSPAARQPWRGGSRAACQARQGRHRVRQAAWGEDSQTRPAVLRPPQPPPRLQRWAAGRRTSPQWPVRRARSPGAPAGWQQRRQQRRRSRPVAAQGVLCLPSETLLQGRLCFRRMRLFRCRLSTLKTTCVLSASPWPPPKSPSLSSANAAEKCITAPPSVATMTRSFTYNSARRFHLPPHCASAFLWTKISCVCWLCSLPCSTARRSAPPARKASRQLQSSAWSWSHTRTRFPTRSRLMCCSVSRSWLA